MTARTPATRTAPSGDVAPEVLAARAAAGDRSAYSELVRSLSPRLFNFLLRRVGDAHEAEDLTQETFVRAWRAIGTFDPTRKFTTWLYTIGLRLAVSTHRSRRRGRLVLTEMERAQDTSNAEPAERTEPERLGAQLWEIAGRELTDDQHTLLWLRYAEDLSMADIGTVVGKSEVAVRVALFRAREKLMDAAARDGLDAARVRAASGGEIETTQQVTTDRPMTAGRGGLVGGAS